MEPLSRGRSTTQPRLECDGETATLEQVWALDLSPSGHFTAMQVRGRRTLGIDFHLDRLDAATRELFDVGLDGDRVREYIRHALADDIDDASVRVNVFRRNAAADVSVMIGVRPPAPTPADPQKLLPVDYMRPRAHIKHASGFGQGYFAGLAQANGFDEALFVGPDGRIAEGSITNIGFVSGDEIVWPEAPRLDGVMMRVLQRELDRSHISWRSAPVRIEDVSSLDGAFVTNSRGFASVARIGELEFPTDAALSRTARQLLAAAPYDPI